MVGTMTQAEANQDIADGMAAGFDAFALNTHDITDSWALNSISYLFTAADQLGFKLFISFDMSWGTITPADIPPFLQNYISHSSYYTVNGRPFVSTYDGGSTSNADWQSGFKAPLASAGVNPFFVPDFDDWSGWPSNVFSNFPVIDGSFSWESAWPSPGTTISNVTDSVDQNVLQQAHAAGKIYMMRKQPPTPPPFPFCPCPRFFKNQAANHMHANQLYLAASSSIWVRARTGTASERLICRSDSRKRLPCSRI